MPWVTHDDGLVRHRRHIGAARVVQEPITTAICAMPAGRHRRLIVKNPAKVLAIRKNLGLMRQVGASGIDQINAGQPILARNFLWRANASLPSSDNQVPPLMVEIVADDDAFATRHGGRYR